MPLLEAECYEGVQARGICSRLQPAADRPWPAALPLLPAAQCVPAPAARRRGWLLLPCLCLQACIQEAVLAQQQQPAATGTGPGSLAGKASQQAAGQAQQQQEQQAGQAAESQRRDSGEEQGEALPGGAAAEGSPAAPRLQLLPLLEEAAGEAAGASNAGSRSEPSSSACPDASGGVGGVTFYPAGTTAAAVAAGAGTTHFPVHFE